MNPCGSGTYGGSKRFRNKMFDCGICIGEHADNCMVYRGIHRWNMSQQKIRMSVEQCSVEGLREVVSHVDQCVNSFQMH